MSWELTSIRPESGSRFPRTRLTRVDLPAPFGPMIPVMGFLTPKLHPSTATRPPKPRLSLVASRTGAPITPNSLSTGARPIFCDCVRSEADSLAEDAIWSDEQDRPQDHREDESSSVNRQREVPVDGGHELHTIRDCTDRQCAEQGSEDIAAPAQQDRRESADCLKDRPRARVIGGDVVTSDTASYASIATGDKEGSHSQSEDRLAQ